MEIRSTLVRVRDVNVMAEAMLRAVVAPYDGTTVERYVQMHKFANREALLGVVYRALGDLLKACTDVQVTYDGVIAVADFSEQALMAKAKVFYEAPLLAFVLPEHQHFDACLLDALMCNMHYTKYDVANTMIRTIPQLLVRPQ